MSVLILTKFSEKQDIKIPFGLAKNVTKKNLGIMLPRNILVIGILKLEFCLKEIATST